MMFFLLLITAMILLKTIPELVEIVKPFSNKNIQKIYNLSIIGGIIFTTGFKRILWIEYPRILKGERGVLRQNGIFFAQLRSGVEDKNCFLW